MAQEQFDIQKRYEKKKEEERKKEKGIVDDKKKVVQVIKVEVPAGAAKPGPPLGSVLGQQQINTAEFCKEFNKLTEKMEKDTLIPVLIYKKADKSFDIVLRSPTTTYYRTQFMKTSSGSDNSSNSNSKRDSKQAFVGIVIPKVNSMLKVKPTNDFNLTVKYAKSVLNSLNSSKLKLF